MNKFLKSPLFLSGLALRLAILAVVLPVAPSVWYVPFLESSIGYFSVDPWYSFISNGGSVEAFPYGYVMWLVFMPLTLICHFLEIGLYAAYGMTLIVADIAVMISLKKLFQLRNQTVLVTYWLSPIVIFATYWLGYNEVIPVALLLFALVYIRQCKPTQAGIFCGAAVSAKLSMVLAIPFVLVYLHGNKVLRQLQGRYIMSLGAVLSITFIPLVISWSGVDMLLGNPEISKVYQLSLQLGYGAPQIFVLPMLYLIMIYLMWRVRRISFKLLNFFWGMAFFLVVLLTPSSSGWYVWIVPVLVFYQSISRSRNTSALVIAFSLLYVINAFLVAPPSLIFGGDLAGNVFERLNFYVGDRTEGILRTLFFALGIILLFRIWREGVLKDEYFRVSRKPIVIGIAGDSGAGKDTLAASIEGLFGKHSVVNLSGDDYHLWDRKKPMWQVMTHLNPKANDLEQYTIDLIALSNDQPIQSRHYDHSSGQRSRPQRIDSNDVIIASGLHALHLPILRSCYDLSIYLDIDEALRRHFKIERDVKKRGHTLEKVLSSFDKREVDSIKFVRPQMGYADLVLALRPIHPRMLEGVETRHPLRLKLIARSRNGISEESLVRVLVGVCGLHVDMAVSDDGAAVELCIEGETSAEDVAMAARTLFPNMRELLDITPHWEEGIQGLMQLITLSHINQALKKRLI